MWHAHSSIRPLQIYSKACRDTQTPEWNQRLTVPIKTPNVSDTIRISLYDEDFFQRIADIKPPGELLAFELESFDRARKSKKGSQRFYHLYGHHGESLQHVIQKCKDEGDDEPPRTLYLGKILIGLQVNAFGARVS